MIPFFHRKKDSVYRKGLRGERMAEKALAKDGLRVTERRWRCAGGEVDLICRKDDAIVFVEVKYRPEGGRGDGVAAVTEDKMTRLKRCADIYMARFPQSFARIDIVEITADGVWHLEDVR